MTLDQLLNGLLSFNVPEDLDKEVYIRFDSKAGKRKILKVSVEDNTVYFDEEE